MREYLEELREHWNDSYWRADHIEVTAALAAIITGLIGLMFAWLETILRREVSHG
jgi:hypothetical protein